MKVTVYVYHSEALNRRVAVEDDGLTYYNLCPTQNWYAVGKFPPRYPLPAIPVRVGYMPAHHTQIFPSAYWYVVSLPSTLDFLPEVRIDYRILIGRTVMTAQEVADLWATGTLTDIESLMKLTVLHLDDDNDAFPVMCAIITDMNDRQKDGALRRLITLAN